MNRLFEIAKELSVIATSRFELKQQLEATVRNIKTQEAAIIPAGGWPGANADTRKAAETAAKAADEPLRMLAMDKAAIEEELDRLELDREALTAEREAWHWTIRDRETQGCMTESVFDLMDAWSRSQAETVADADDEAAEAFEQALSGEPVTAVDDDGDSDLPF